MARVGCRSGGWLPVVESGEPADEFFAGDGAAADGAVLFGAFAGGEHPGRDRPGAGEFADDRRRNTARSWRRTSNSASFAAVHRGSSASHPASRTNIR